MLDIFDFWGRLKLKAKYVITDIQFNNKENDQKLIHVGKKTNKDNKYLLKY